MTGSAPTGEADDALLRVTSALADAEQRDGQRDMADMVASAIATRRHLVVQAGTGKQLELTIEVPVEDMARLSEPVYDSGPAAAGRPTASP